jgi:tRNA pseudouridine55 synthase
MTARRTAPSGLLIVDKPAGLTSHDVVGRVRRLAGTRRVGHAGTLDPMATGVLVVGIEKATRLLGHLALTQKEYAATIRLGESTDSDDADGEIVAARPADHVTDAALRQAAAALTGEIQQVPPGISAIKVGGQRAYRLTREGAPPDLPARTVTVFELEITDIRCGAGPAGVRLDVDARVTCSSGTYIRAIARDLGEALGTGGHLTALRRTRVGPYRIADSTPLDVLASSFGTGPPAPGPSRTGPSGTGLARTGPSGAEPSGAEPSGTGLVRTGSPGPGSAGPGALPVIPLAAAAAAAFDARQLTADEARLIAHGGRLAALGTGPAPVAAFGPDGELIALLTEADGQARSLAVFTAGDS